MFEDPWSFALPEPRGPLPKAAAVAPRSSQFALYNAWDETSRSALRRARDAAGLFAIDPLLLRRTSGLVLVLITVWLMTNCEILSKFVDRFFLRHPQKYSRNLFFGGSQAPQTVQTTTDRLERFVSHPFLIQDKTAINH